MQLRVGDFDLYRAQIDVNRTFLNRKAAFRINLLNHDEGDWMNHAFYKKQGLHAAGTWQLLHSPSATTTLRAEMEKLNLERVIGSKFPLKDRVSDWNGIGIPASGNLTGITGTTTMTANRRILDQAAGTYFLSTNVIRTSGPSGTSFTDERLVPRSMNFYGSGNHNDSDVENYTVMLEQRLFRDLFIEAAFNKQEDTHSYYTVDGFEIYRDPRSFIGTVANPRFGEYFVEHAYQFTKFNNKIYEPRLTASYERDLGKWWGRHQLAALASRRQSISHQIGFSFDDIPTNGQLLFRRHIKDGDGERFTRFDPAGIAATAAAGGANVGWRQGTLNHSETLLLSRQLVHVGNFFDGRLSTVFGARHDELQRRAALNGTRDVVTTEPLFKRRREWVDFKLSDWQFVAKDRTRTKGATLGWSAKSPVRIYYNQSESFVNQSGSLPLGLVDRELTFPPRVGEGKDMGVRFRLFNDRIQGSFGRFETNDVGARTFLHGWFDQSTQFVARDLLRRTDYTGWQDTVTLASKGKEFELTANLTKNLRLHFNAARTDLQTSNHGPYAKSFLLGKLLPEWSKWAAGWRQVAGEALPAGVTNNTSDPRGSA